jgi:hypothetical protein
MNEVYVIESPATGMQGPQGVPGPQGPAGPQGSAGQIGTTGPQGATGPQGTGYQATSSTPLALTDTANISFTTQPGLAYSVGARVRLSSAGTPATWMEGPILSYDSTSGAMTVAAGLKLGTAGTYNDWNVNLAGIPGTYSGAPLGSMATQNANTVAITGGSITGMADPTAPLDVANKEYVDARVGGIGEAPVDSKLYGRVNAVWTAGVKLAGDTMTGALGLPTLAVDYSGTNAVNAAWVFGQNASLADYFGTNSAKKIITPWTVWSAAAAVPTGALTAFSPDLATASDFVWTLNNANCQLNNPLNLKNGQKGVIYVAQDATGARAITTWGSAYKFANGLKPTLSTAPNAVDVISYACAGSAAAPVMYCFFSPNLS